MLTKDTISQKRDILLDYLNRYGAISRGSSVKDVAIVREAMGLDEKDFLDICEHFNEAGWIKFWDRPRISVF